MFNTGDKVKKVGSEEVYVVVSVAADMITVRPNRRGRPVFQYVPVAELVLVSKAVAPKPE